MRGEGVSELAERAHSNPRTAAGQDVSSAWKDLELRRQPANASDSCAVDHAWLWGLRRVDTPATGLVAKNPSEGSPAEGMSVRAIKSLKLLRGCSEPKATFSTNQVVN